MPCHLSSKQWLFGVSWFGYRHGRQEIFGRGAGYVEGRNNEVVYRVESVGQRGKGNVGKEHGISHAMLSVSDVCRERGKPQTLKGQGSITVT
jgi:hypothetical protein